MQFSLESSSVGHAVADDGLKDHDNLHFLCELEPAARADFRRRLQWVRLVDRLAEERLLYGDPDDLAEHFIVPREPAEFGVSWCEAWQRYVIAVNRYHRPKTLVPDLAAHQQMLLELSGNIFCLLPEVDWSLRRAIAHFGALDQFFNNLRDLDEDAEQNLCHFPLETLAHFGLVPGDIVDKSCLGRWGYFAMIEFWLEEYLPKLRHEAAEFTNWRGLPRSLELMRESCLRRYARIERVFRACEYDFVAARAAYWSEVERELGSGVSHPKPARSLLA
jgi:phytoene synthase